MIVFHSRLYHKLALIICAVIGMVYVSHHFFVPYFLKEDNLTYYPITKNTFHDEATFYALRANAAYQGQWLAGDISLAEYKDSPVILSVINPVILGGLGWIIGSLKSAFIISDFLFPALIFLILYFIFFELTRRKIPSLLFSTIFILSPKLTMYLPPVTALNLRELIKSFLPFLNNEPLYFSQFEEPKITFIFLCLAYYFIIRALRNKTVPSTVFAGISFGFLFYTYFYDWVSVAVALFLLAGIFLVRRDFSSLKRLISIGCIGVLVSAGYWVNYLYLRKLPQYKEIFSEVGVEIGRRFRFYSVWKSYLRIIILSLMPVAIYLSHCFYHKNRDSGNYRYLNFWKRPEVLFITMFLFSYFVTVNIQLVTGYNVQPDHWYRTLFLPVGIIFFLIFLALYDLFIRESYKPVLKNGAYIFLIVFILMYAGAEFNKSRIQAQDYTVSRQSLESYAWLNENAKRGSVVGAIAYDTNYEILLHTHNKIFLPIGLATIAPHEERWQRLILLSGMYGLQSDVFYRVAEGGAYYLFAARFTDHGFDQAFYRSSSNYKIPAVTLGRKTKEYDEYVLPENIPFQIDYLYFGPRERSLGQLQPAVLSKFKKVYSKGDIEIYKSLSEL